MEIDMSQREKHWGEIAVDEKIDRMREIIHGLQLRIEELEGRVINLQFHEHNRQGDVVVHINRGGNYTDVSAHRVPGTPDDVWF